MTDRQVEALTLGLMHMAIAIMAVAIRELNRQSDRIEIVVTKADLAAMEVRHVIDEAKRITMEAAEELGEDRP